MTDVRILTAEIPLELAGLRLDQALTELFPDFTRSRLQTWIRNGSALVNGETWAPKTRIVGGERVVLCAAAEAGTSAALAQDIPLSIVYEDESLLIVDKPAGLVVHPAAGHRDGTLQNALLHHCPDLSAVPRSGIVHRIDKDTSGLLMAAKTLTAHKSLVNQLQARTVHREYLALVHGTPTAGGTVDQPIGRHAVDRKRFAVREGGRPAVTHYRLAERFPQHTLLRVKLETGRTHQIRVHMAYIHHPLVGDPDYGGRPRPPAGASSGLLSMLRDFRRQALHAESLGLAHSETGEYREWRTPLPADFSALMDALRSG